MEPVRIAVAPGDGIGPEITDAVLAVLAAAEAPIDVVEVYLGAAAVADGNASGVARARSR
jgi:isocitrate dehydrogenase